MKKILLFMFLGFVSLFAVDMNSSISVPHVEYANPDGMPEKYRIGKFGFQGVSNVYNDENGVPYQIFSYKKGKFDITKSKSIETFFGKRSEYNTQMKKQLSANIANGSINMLSNSSGAIASGTANIGASLGVGAGLGIFQSLLIGTVDYLSQDYEYVRVISYIDEKGNKGKITSLYVSTKDNKNHEEIRYIMAKKESSL